MNTLQNLTQNSQRAVCLFFAALIVASSLSIGVVAGHVAFENAVAATLG
ncbi:MAG TPA: hypothetical protein VKB34_16605 [Povalibacter sp.]|nr:hypothetical protein [Povalibacter sp.]